MLQAAFFLLVCRAQARVLLRATPINWPSPWEWRNFLNYVYNTYSCKWTQEIYIYIDSTPWKAIIGMALRAIKTTGSKKGISHCWYCGHKWHPPKCKETCWYYMKCEKHLYHMGESTDCFLQYHKELGLICEILHIYIDYFSPMRSCIYLW